LEFDVRRKEAEDDASEVGVAAADICEVVLGFGLILATFYFLLLVFAPEPRTPLASRLRKCVFMA